MLSRPQLRVGAAAAVVAVAAVLLYMVDPSDAPLLPHCPFHWLTGFYCPGCGSTRALHELLHGNPWAALDYNPLAVVALPFLVYAFVSAGWRELGGPGLPRFFIPQRWILALLALIVAYWVLRNVPVEPFVWLAP